MIVKEWEFPLLRELVIHNTVLTSAEALKFLGLQGVEISRASVIGTLNRWSADGILKYTEKRGRGGKYKIYQRAVNGEGWLEMLRKELDEVYDLAYQKMGRGGI